MNSIKEYWPVFLVAASIVGIDVIAIIYFIPSEKLTPSIISIMTASATVLTSVFSIVLSKHIDLKMQVAKDLRNKKTPVYEELLRFVFDVDPERTETDTLLSERTKLFEKELDKFAKEFSPKFIAWSSDDVLLAFCEYREVIDNIQCLYKGKYVFDIETKRPVTRQRSYEKLDPESQEKIDKEIDVLHAKLMFKIIKLLSAIRKDLGYKGKLTKYSRFVFHNRGEDMRPSIF